VPKAIFAPRRGHSEKPGEAYERLERLFGDVRRLELFAFVLSPDAPRLRGSAVSPIQSGKALGGRPLMLSLKDYRPSGVNVSHQFVAIPVPLIGVVTSGESVIGEREVLRW